MRKALAAVTWVGLMAFGACSDDASPPAARPPLPDRTSSTSSSSSSSGAPVAGDDDSGAGAEEDAGPVLARYDINHVLSTGQSLSVGAVGSPALSTTQPFANQMLDADGGAFVPLVETTVETMSSAFANLTADLSGNDHDLLVTVHGVGGFSYAQLKKGTTPYANGIAQVKAAVAIAKRLGKSHVVRAVTNVHGESDHLQNNISYQVDLTNWQADYEADVKAITGQTEPIPMLHSQMSSYTKLGSATSRIPLDQLAVHIASKGKNVLVGPKYHLPYVGDGVHLTNEGYRHMGEDYAKVYRRIVLEGKPWEPLRPREITRIGKVITVKFIVPAPPLVLDDVTVKNPADYGFELTQDGAPPPNIESVDVTAPDTVTIQLAAEPTGANRRLRYAIAGAPNANGGPTTGARGNLRDADDTKSRHGYSLWNWCVHFEEALP